MLLHVKEDLGRFKDPTAYRWNARYCYIFMEENIANIYGVGDDCKYLKLILYLTFLRKLGLSDFLS